MGTSFDIPGSAFPWNQPCPNPSSLDIQLLEDDLGEDAVESPLGHFVGHEPPAGAFKQEEFEQLRPTNLVTAMGILQNMRPQVITRTEVPQESHIQAHAETMGSPLPQVAIEMVRLQPGHPQESLPPGLVAWLHDRSNAAESMLRSSRQSNGPLTVKTLYQHLGQKVGIDHDTHSPRLLSEAHHGHSDSKMQPAPEDNRMPSGG
jgi:hypothetical protein